MRQRPGRLNQLRAGFAVSVFPAPSPPRTVVTAHGGKHQGTYRRPAVPRFTHLKLAGVRTLNWTGHHPARPQSRPSACSTISTRDSSVRASQIFRGTLVAVAECVPGMAGHCARKVRVRASQSAVKSAFVKPGLSQARGSGRTGPVRVKPWARAAWSMDSGVTYPASTKYFRSQRWSREAHQV